MRTAVRMGGAADGGVRPSAETCGNSDELGGQADGQRKGRGADGGVGGDGGDGQRCPRRPRRVRGPGGRRRQTAGMGRPSAGTRGDLAAAWPARMDSASVAVDHAADGDSVGNIDHAST